jgi:hypothetical protein
MRLFLHSLVAFAMLSIGASGWAQSTTVTFQVDMNQLSEPATYGAIFLNASFTGWCGGCDPMTDADNDGIWTLTKTLDPGTYEYKFTIDGWNAQEWFSEGEACTSTIDGFTNRTVTVAGIPLELAPECFSECGPCQGAVTGCTYMIAVNYDPMATIDDNSCTFDGNVSTGCPSDLNGDGTVSTADLLEFLISFGQVC